MSPSTTRSDHPTRAAALLGRRVAASLTFGFVLAIVHIARADDAASAIYIRQDTDHTTVISPRVHVSKALGESDSTTTVDAAYAADIWTSASIDIRASASVRPVSEQRDEIVLGIQHELNDFSLHGGYRFSTEQDYLSHGLTLGARYALAGKASTLDATVHALADTVGRAGDPRFARSVNTLDASFSYTQLFDPKMFGQATYEFAVVDGYQASPYRFVGIGSLSSGFGCRGATLCLAESVPDLRSRHAFALSLRRALTDAISVGLSYRLYGDSWSLLSHTALADIGWSLDHHTVLRLSYRFYRQNRARFYSARYLESARGGYRTRDKELSPLAAQRCGLELTRDFPFADGARTLSATLAVGGNYYHYYDFIGLTHSLALEITAAVQLHI
jgi:hypothetical protein